MAERKPEFPWYDTVEGRDLEQGDILFGFEIFVPASDFHADETVLQGEMRSLDLIVMTQTCDIQHGNVASLLLCPCWDLWTFIEAANAKGENWGTSQREALRRGNLPGYHLINEGVQDGVKLGIAVVDFREVHTAPTERAKQFAASAGKRLRLRPPYKEHLSQAFARFFMRVGLPIDIPSDKLKQRPS